MKNLFKPTSCGNPAKFVWQKAIETHDSNEQSEKNSNKMEKNENPELKNKLQNILNIKNPEQKNKKIKEIIDGAKNKKREKFLSKLRNLKLNKQAETEAITKANVILDEEGKNCESKVLEKFQNAIENPSNGIKHAIITDMMTIIAKLNNTDTKLGLQKLNISEGGLIGSLINEISKKDHDKPLSPEDEAYLRVVNDDLTTGESARHVPITLNMLNMNK